MWTLPGSGSAGGAGHAAPAARPAGRWLLVFVSALVRTVAFLLTSALVAAAVSYYMVPYQVDRELEAFNEQWAEFRMLVEERIGCLEESAAGSGQAEPAAGETGEQAQPPGTPDAGAPAEDVPGPEDGGRSAPAEPADEQVVVRTIRAALALLAGQDRLVLSFAEVVRRDWGAASEGVGLAARMWEEHGFAVLAEQARQCQSDLAKADPEGTARLRLLLFQSQKALTALVGELPSQAPPEDAL